MKTQQLSGMVKTISLAAGLTLGISAASSHPRTSVEPQWTDTTLAPVTVNGRVLVPLRSIAHGMGARVLWNAAKSLITVQAATTTITMQVGNSVAFVGDRQVHLDQAPIAYRGHTLVPLRFIAEAMGAKVTWNNGALEITLERSDEDLTPDPATTQSPAPGSTQPSRRASQGNQTPAGNPAASAPAMADKRNGRAASVSRPQDARTPDDQTAEQRIAELMTQHPEQKRPKLRYNAILAKVARERAADMARRRYFSHTNPDGVGPNYLVAQAGYVLPEWYGKAKDANFIESIGAGTETAEATWRMWMESSGHRTHILASKSFYADQIEYGIGHFFDPKSPYRHYWVVITAQPGP